MAIPKFKDLRFPRNLGTSDVPNYINFTPMLMEYGGTKKLTQGSNAVSHPSSRTGGQGSPSYSASVSNPTSIVENFQQGIDGLSQTAASVAIEAQKASAAISSGQDPLRVATTALGRLAQITNTTLEHSLKNLDVFSITTDRDKIKSAGTISLYLPQELTTNSSVDYETAALGGMGVQAVETASQIESIGFLDGLGKLIQGGLQDALGSGNRRAIIGVAQNIVTNNFSFQVFNSVLHRQFQYSFRLMPKDGEESKVIKELCDLFLFYMLPARAMAGDIGFYEIPCQWQIEYRRGDAKLQYHQQPKNCFLTSVDVQYGGDAGNSTYNDGAPMEINLSLQFVEIEPLYREGEFFNESSGAGIMNAAKKEQFGTDARHQSYMIGGLGH